MDRLQASARKVQEHPPAAQKAAEAQASAVSPGNERLAGAQAAKVGTMQQAETGKPEKNSFLTLLRAEIEKVMPRSLGDTESFLEGGGRQALSQAATGNVSRQRQQATEGIRSASERPPDTGSVPAREAAPLQAEPAPPAPARVGAAEAMPAPQPESAVSLEGSRQDADQSLREAEVTTPQLQRANDPRFAAVVDARAQVDRNAQTAPAAFRASEQRTLAQGAARATGDETAAVAALGATRARSRDAVRTRQSGARQRDEARRKQVADSIEKIYNETQQAVEAKLSGLDQEVSAAFDSGVDAAINSMKQYVERRKDAYKRERYSGLNFWKWARDKLLGLPDEVKRFYVEGRQNFIAELDSLIVRIANLVESRLREAKQEIAKGQQRIHDYVATLPRDLQAVGRQAEQEMNGRFEDMRRGVDDRANELAQRLAQRYRESVDRAEAALREMREKDKGLVTRLKEKLAEVVRILRELKSKLMSVIRQGLELIKRILADPIGFLSNLIRAVKAGVMGFASRIFEHLVKGLVDWLFGAFAGTGIEMPKDLSLPSILHFVMQVLGLTWQRIRAKVVRVVGERNMALLEKAVELVSLLVRSGPMALWEKLKEHLADLKQQVMGAIQEWVVTTIVRAAITKLLSMLNPVGAFVQAVIAIYNTVMFFIERINQILAFVQAVINSVAAIASGAIGAAAGWIEQSLARTIPLIIGFLARLIGLGGIVDKVKSIIQRIQSRIENAIDRVIEKIVAGVRGVVSAGKAAVARVVQWWRARRSFRAGGASHSLYFSGEGAAARLMVASDATELEAFLQQAKKKPGADKAAIGRIEAQIKKIKASEKRIEGGKLSDSEKTAEADKIAAGFDAIVPDLTGLIGADQAATEQNPLPLEYPKRRTARYPVLYFGPRSSRPISQALLKEGFTTPAQGIARIESKLTASDRKAWIASGERVERFDPHSSRHLPDGGPEVGLAETWRINPGKKICMNPERTTGGGKINDVLRPYGFAPGEEGLDGDHVLERQLGGPDAVLNLWPLDKGENRSSGSTLKQMNFRIGSSKVITMDELKARKAKSVWFVIAKTRS